MSLTRILLVLGLVVVGVSGCNLFQKPSKADDTTQSRGSDVWWNNRMNEKEISAQINEDRPESASNNVNENGNIGLQP